MKHYYLIFKKRLIVSCSYKTGKYDVDNTPNTFGNYIKEVSSNFEIALEKIWFHDKQMKADPDKCHLLYSADEPVILNTLNEMIRNNKYQKVIGINTDCRFTFHTHLNEIYKKAGDTLNV